jgi:hypothetical protein
MIKEFCIKEIPFTPLSILSSKKPVLGYIESNECVFETGGRQIEFEDVKRAFIKAVDGSNDPWWMKLLEKIRDKAALLIGSKEFYTKENMKQTDNKNILTPKDKIGGSGFTVYEVLENELIVGADDKNLNFRLSVVFIKKPDNKDVYRIIESSVVSYNHWFGRVEFFFVKPFHKAIIVPMLMKKMMTEI